MFCRENSEFQNDNRGMSSRIKNVNGIIRFQKLIRRKINFVLKKGKYINESFILLASLIWYYTIQVDNVRY